MAIPETLYTVQVRLNMDTNLPADAVTNTWHFASGLAESAVAAAFDDQVIPDLHQFYVDCGTGLSSAINGANIDWKLYHTATPPPNAPLGTGTLDTVATSTVSAPPELAIVMSYQATVSPGISQARRRNRIYLGPLGFVSTGGLIPNTYRDLMQAAGQNFIIAAAGWADFQWVVYSPTAQTIAAVNNGWVDNAYDIQRRRGLKATERVTFD